MGKDDEEDDPLDTGIKIEFDLIEIALIGLIGLLIFAAAFFVGGIVLCHS